MNRNPMLKKRRRWPKAISNWEYPARSCLFHDQASEGAKNWKERTEQKKNGQHQKTAPLCYRESFTPTSRQSISASPSRLLQSRSCCSSLRKTLRKGTKGGNRRSKPLFPFSCNDYNKLARDQKLEPTQLLNEEEEEEKEEHGLSRAFFPYLVSLSTSLISML